MKSGSAQAPNTSTPRIMRSCPILNHITASIVLAPLSGSNGVISSPVQPHLLNFAAYTPIEPSTRETVICHSQKWGDDND
jgi:hypothetical protein